MRSLVQAVKSRLNILDLVRRHVNLKRQGNRWVGPCPFHQETKPSFSVNEEEGVFYCFGCQAAGDIIEFASKINGTDFKETLEQLAAEAGLDTSAAFRRKGRDGNDRPSQRSAILQAMKVAQSVFVDALRGPAGQDGRDYVASRGLSPEIVEGFGIGWAPREWRNMTDALRRARVPDDVAQLTGLVARSPNKGNVYDRFRGRLIFPIKNLSNQIVAFGGRIVNGAEDEAKYINSPETPVYKKGEHLYGLAQARQAITAKGDALLTEGYMDVLTLHQFGYGHAVGVLGTALTPEQIKRISGFTSKVTLLFDGDRAGRKAALKAAEMFLVRGLTCRVVLLPEGKDIDETLRQDGPEAFDLMQRRAREGLGYCADALREQSPKDRVEWARNFLKAVTMPELLNGYISELATGLDLAEDVLRKTSTRRIVAPGKPAAAIPASGTPMSLQERQVLTFVVRYPARLPELQDLGADILLVGGLAKRLWGKIERSGEEAFRELDDQERGFWNGCRMGEAAPMDDGEKEFALLKAYLERTQAQAQRRFAANALRRGGGNFESDAVLLGLVKQTVDREKAAARDDPASPGGTSQGG
ncbi:MAG: DNA primase [Desulfovibrio sp.]|jgi:DNA primase|nr:DNA primase [Desulfovibrio sp.]